MEIGERVRVKGKSGVYIIKEFVEKDGKSWIDLRHEIDGTFASAYEEDLKKLLGGGVKNGDRDWNLGGNPTTVGYKFKGEDRTLEIL